MDDRFTQRKVVLSVKPETRKLYDRVISNFGVSDEDLEKHFVEALDRLLQEKAAGIQEIRKELKR